MKTVTLEQPGHFTITDTPAPQRPKAGEALVRVRRVGICGTDIHAFRGRQPFFTYPRILGHELGVEVVECGGGSPPFSPGDRCAVEPYLNCGRCAACRAGKTNCCIQLNVLGVHSDGGMRELITVPQLKLHKSTALTLEQLALVETLGIGAHAVQRARLNPGECVLVIGAGPIGLSVIQFAQLAGARIIVLDVNEKRLAFCNTHFSVEHILLESDSVLQQLKEITGGDLPSAVFDATGNGQSMGKAFSYVAHGGRLVLVGLFQGDVSFNDPEFHRRELTVLATRNSTSGDFQNIITLMEEGKIDTQPWITHRADCNVMIGRFEEWINPQSGCIKAMVEF